MPVSVIYIHFCSKESVPSSAVNKVISHCLNWTMLEVGVCLIFICFFSLIFSFVVLLLYSLWSSIKLGATRNQNKWSLVYLFFSFRLIFITKRFRWTIVWIFVVGGHRWLCNKWLSAADGNCSDKFVVSQNVWHFHRWAWEFMVVLSMFCNHFDVVTMQRHLYCFQKQRW